MPDPDSSRGVRCLRCLQPLPANAKRCPNCRTPRPSDHALTVFLGVIGLIALIVFVVAMLKTGQHEESQGNAAVSAVGQISKAIRLNA